MLASQTYRFQAQRIIEAAKAANDEWSVIRAQHLLNAIPCSDNLVASYARQISDETTCQVVAALADDLAKATVSIDMMMALEDLQR